MGRSFGLQAGRLIARKYEVLGLLGGGWQGEVYRVMERGTRIERAAKLFYPDSDPRSKAARLYAKKLHKLRDCRLPIQYHAEEEIRYRREPVRVLISEFVEGDPLPAFLSRQPGKRLQPFEGLHFLHALATGLAEIHQAGEYHGDLHVQNIIVQRRGLTFELKLLDIFQEDESRVEGRRSDLLDCIRIFHEALGGARHYRKQPKVVKEIVRGLRRGLIMERFPTMNQLVKHLEAMDW